MIKSVGDGTTMKGVMQNRWKLVNFSQSIILSHNLLSIDS